MENYHILGNKINDDNQKNILEQFFLFTYTENFPPIKGNYNNTFTNDIGWGCTIRSGQMLLYNFFYNLYKNNNIVLELFNNPESEFSLHNIVKNGDIEIGKWYGNYSLSITIEKIFNNLFYNIKLNVIHKTTIIKNNIYKQLENNELLLLIPFKMGIHNHINIDYIHILLSLLNYTNSLGFIGGKNTSSYYFIGHSDTHLLYLDPHDITEYDPNIKDNQLKLNEIKKINFENISSELTFGFYIKNKKEFDNFINFLDKLNNKLYFINIIEKDIEYKNIDIEEDNDEWQLFQI
jgi:cysteine protease ATG4